MENWLTSNVFAKLVFKLLILYIELSFSGSAQFSKTYVVSILKTTSTICFIIKDITISQNAG